MGLIGDDEADGEIVTLLEQALARYGAGNPLTGPALLTVQAAQAAPGIPTGPQPPGAADHEMRPTPGSGTAVRGGIQQPGPWYRHPRTSHGHADGLTLMDLDGPGRAPGMVLAWPCLEPETVTDPGSPHSKQRFVVRTMYSCT